MNENTKKHYTFEENTKKRITFFAFSENFQSKSKKILKNITRNFFIKILK